MKNKPQKNTEEDIYFMYEIKHECG